MEPQSTSFGERLTQLLKELGLAQVKVQEELIREVEKRHKNEVDLLKTDAKKRYDELNAELEEVKLQLNKKDKELQELLKDLTNARLEFESLEQAALCYKIDLLNLQNIKAGKDKIIQQLKTKLDLVNKCIRLGSASTDQRTNQSAPNGPASNSTEENEIFQGQEMHLSDTPKSLMSRPRRGNWSSQNRGAGRGVRGRGRRVETQPETDKSVAIYDRPVDVVAGDPVEVVPDE